MCTYVRRTVLYEYTPAPTRNMAKKPTDLLSVPTATAYPAMTSSGEWIRQIARRLMRSDTNVVTPVPMEANT